MERARLSSLSILALAAALLPECHASIHQQFNPTLQAKTFDYIIVGAGASGAVVANRLSEDPSVSVLLIEAGSSDVNATDIVTPGLVFGSWGTRFDWNFTTTPQEGFNGRSLHYTRGLVLGGSTSINEMVWCRGSRDDYDRWANVTGDSGWSWESIYPYFFNKLDRITPPADNHDTTGQFDPKLHGDTGMVNTSLYGFALDTTQRSIAISDNSSEFFFNLDYNSGDPLGLSYIQQTISGGARFSSYTGYILPALARPNLDIVVNTIVTRVLQTDTQDGVPVFRGVEIVDPTSSHTVSLTARREVILSAGAIQSPHILLSSGIGDASYLQSVGVQPLVDLPDVGQNLQDHIFMQLIWNVQPNATTYDILRENATFAAEAEAQWQASRSGPLTIVGGATWGFFRLPADSPAFEVGLDPSAGPTSAHFEMVVVDEFSSAAVSPPSTGKFLTIQFYLISPASRGNITLASSDPRAYPLLNPNYLSAPVDRAIIREAVRNIRSYVASPSWADWVTSEFPGAQADATTDDEIDAFVATQGVGGLHISGTVAMGPQGTSARGSGALNPDLTVKGSVGLRVVDTSAFPFVITGHTQAPAYVLAERASDIIKSAAQD